MPRDQEAKPPRSRGSIKLARTARCVLLLALALGFASLTDDARAQAFTPDIAAPGIAASSVVNPGIIAGSPGSGKARIVPGSAAISGFSGARLSAESLRPGVDPLNKTVIDTASASLRVFDLTALGPQPAGQKPDLATIFEVKADEIGQVFPLTLDDGDGPAARSGTVNFYAGATSAFGIQIVAAQPDSDGTPIRLKTGAPGARFMDGQFGSFAGASPGVIWKIDGMTGKPSIFADTGQNGPGNSGPGIGGLAFDPVTRSLYASDLDNGLILRFPIDGGGRPSAQFDHGATGLSGAERTPIPDDGVRMDIDKPSFRPDAPVSWGFTPAGRRIDGLAVYEERLYYAVAEGPEIWSVGLLADGGFASDARFEIAVLSQGAPVVTKIVFDASGRMTLALRGAARSPFDYSRFVDADSGGLLRFTPAQRGGADPSPLWLARPESYVIGASPGGSTASEGVSLGHPYRGDGNLDMEGCDAMLLATGNVLGIGRGNAATQDLQLNGSERLRSGNEPPVQSTLLDFGSRHGNLLQLGHVGDVAAFQRCAGQGDVFLADNAAPPVVESPPPVAVSGAAPLAVQGGTGNVAVAKAPAEQKTPAPVSLRIDNLALTPQCEKSAQAQNWNCAFEVTVTNIGNAPFRGPIVIIDETNFAVIAQPSDGVTCDNNGTLHHRCEIAAVTLAPSASTTFTLNSTLPFVSVPVETLPGGCRLINTVTVSSPPTGGAAASATARLPAVANQGKAVPCDPPSLQLGKTAQGCMPSAGGFACKYRLTVTSTGPDPFQDMPIDIAERLPEGAEVTTVSNGWACTGSGIATYCHHGNVTLSVGAALRLDLTVAVPGNALVRSQCEIDNEAEIVQPGRDMTHAGTRLRASASATIQSPECQPPAPRPIACYGGMALAASGRCECLPGQEYDTIQRSCVSPPPSVCPTGWSGQYPTCCQPGTFYEDGICLLHTAPPLPLNCPRGWQGDYPTCCPPGQDYLEGRCEIPRQPMVVEPRCSGERPVGDWPDCCPVGTSYWRGECHSIVTVPEIRDCGGDRPIGVWPNCCPLGTYFDRGICSPVIVEVPVVCRPGQAVDMMTRRCVDAACTGDRPVGTPPNCCPRGTSYIRGTCRGGDLGSSR